MILIKVIFSLFIISLEYSVSCRDVVRSPRGSYKYNHPPEGENYHAIPVSIVYDEEGAREHKSLKPKVLVSTSTEKSSAKEILSETKTTNKITTSTASYDDNDIEVKNYRHNKKPNQKDIKLKTYFDSEQHIPVAVIYDEPNEAPNSKRNIINNPARERVRGFILRKLDDEVEPSQSETKFIKNPILNKSQQNTITTKTQTEFGNRTSSNTDTKHLNKSDSTVTGKITTPKESENIKSDQMTDTQKENRNSELVKFDVETSNKVVNRESNKNVETTRPQTTENQMEHGNRTTLNTSSKHLNKADSVVVGKISLPEASKHINSHQMTDAQKENRNSEPVKSDIETSNKVIDKENNESVLTTKLQTTENQKEHGNRTTLNTNAEHLNKADSVAAAKMPKEGESINSDHIMDTQKENWNRTYKSDIETTSKLNTVTTKPQTTENQKEHGNRTSLRNGPVDISNSRTNLDQKELIAHKIDVERDNPPNRDKENASRKTNQILEKFKETGDIKSSQVDDVTTINTFEKTGKVNDTTVKPDIKDIKKENGNRTSINARTKNVLSNRRRTERKEEIKVAQVEDSDLQASKAVDTTSIPKFAKRTRGRDPVVPIIESQNRVYGHSGGFHYSYEGGDGTKAFEKGELKTFDDEKTGESVVGGFSYKDKEGNDFSLSYTADEQGYRPVGAHLPTPPPIPPAIARALAYLATKPTPEPDTESVTKAYKDY